MLCLFLTVSGLAHAQTTTNSPYSRFGIGDLQSQSFLKTKGMGGCSRAFSSPLNINFVNPASLASLRLTTFEIAVAGNLTQFESGSLKQQSGTSSLNYFALGFPVKSGKWGTAIGLMPFSNAGYHIVGTGTDDGLAQIHSYEGSGGINQFYFSNAWAPAKWISIGLNSSYLFGTVKEDRRVDFNDASYLDVHVQDAIHYGDFHFTGGVLLTRDSLRLTPSDSLRQIDERLASIGDSIRIFKHLSNRPEAIRDSAYQAATDSSIRAMLVMLEEEYAHTTLAREKVMTRKQRGDWSISLGLTSSLGTKVNAEQDRITETYRGIGSISTAPKDTIENIIRKDGVVNFPFSFGAGVAMKKGTRWLLMADFSMQNWEDFSKFGEADSLKNSWTAATGMQWTPNDRARMKSYFKKVQYRLGFRYGESYLQLRENRLTEYAITAGLGLPIPGTYIQLHGEWGSRGTLNAGLIRENFFRFGIGITLNDRWFVKSTYE